MTERHGEPRQPGWYPDEAGNIRWWNGQFWSHTSPGGRVTARATAPAGPSSAPQPPSSGPGDGVLLGVGGVVTGAVGAAAGLYAWVRPVGSLVVLPAVVLGLVAVGLAIGALRRRHMLLGVLGVMAGTAAVLLPVLLVVVVAVTFAS